MPRMPPQPASPPDRLPAARNRRNIYWRKQSGGEGTAFRHFAQPWRQLGIVAVAGLVIATTVQVRAEDVVVARAKEGRGSIRSIGEITDYTGKQLTLRRVGDREETIDAGRILDVQTAWTAAHRAGDEKFAEGKYEQAFTSYQAALTDETRIWVRRRILAQSVWCLRSTDRVEQAIDVFLQLYRNDSTTQFFPAMPLSWLTEPPSASLEAKARKLITEGDLPAAKLIGASWLLPTSQRASAIATLHNLLNTEDSRVAYWAEAQLWRPQVVTATAEIVARWRSRWTRMSAELQPGPAFVLGQACSRLQQHEDAALLFLRTPILQPLDRGLAAQALLAAGRELETMNQVNDAANVYREILADHAASSSAQTAKERLAQLGARQQ